MSLPDRRTYTREEVMEKFRGFHYRAIDWTVEELIEPSFDGRKIFKISQVPGKPFGANNFSTPQEAANVENIRALVKDKESQIDIIPFCKSMEPEEFDVRGSEPKIGDKLFGIRYEQNGIMKRQDAEVTGYNLRIVPDEQGVVHYLYQPTLDNEIILDKENMHKTEDGVLLEFFDSRQDFIKHLEGRIPDLREAASKAAARAQVEGNRHDSVRAMLENFDGPS